jgi:formylglycine-generating enzyme required for sulfatase activity
MPKRLLDEGQWKFQLMKTRADADEAHARALIDAGELEHAAALLDTWARDDRGRFVPMLREVLDQLEILVMGVRFRYVPAARVSVGDDVGEDDERPARVVDVPAFWMAATPLLVGPKGINGGHFSRFSQFLIGGCAVVAVPWEKAAALSRSFTAEFNGLRLLGRLPFEREWERAARGTLVGAEYPWGDEPPDGSRADFGRFGDWVPRPPTERAPNEYGLFALAGTVWEWCEDCYTDRGVSVDDDPGAIDATAPTNGDRVLRGGSFVDDDIALRVAFRLGAPPHLYGPNIGVRPVLVKAAS